MAAALLQARAVQLVPPGVPSQYPSVPLSPEQATSFPIYEEQFPKEPIQPFPVVIHPESQALQSAFVFRVESASLHV